MKPSTTYQLPFKFLVSEGPLFGAGISTRVSLTVAGRPDMDDVRPLLHAKLMHFGVLCATGAFGVVPPQGFDPMTPLFESAEEGEEFLAWTLTGWPAGDDAVAVLASLFMSGDVAPLLERVEISAKGKTCTSVLPLDGRVEQSYPPRATLPFPNHISHEGQDKFELNLSFNGSPPDEGKGEIEQLLLLWAHAASSGAYGVSPVEPLKCSFQFLEEVDWFGDRLTWHISRFRAHADALDGLMNVCGTIHARLWPIVACKID
ncbi:hypothetical protein [Vitiosangium sp. GDMCC 1.1324]|uniref:hypothetical protein n=1 Tax=Vitiosangium sp. (strain GDMCC 1.1324) TaxID=2138576 RepID=UPI000D34D1AE|nr:hypothetical protein [Vitiosangium sp. GDMCC 1.1324]PTL83392.1 hypothetical protein DAT35_15570 [Vitiosangium sp. GDMCC 1.1324]